MASTAWPSATLGARLKLGGDGGELALMADRQGRDGNGDQVREAAMGNLLARWVGDLM